MGFFKNMKETLSNAYGPQTPEQREKQLEHLSPEQRARYDAQMARVEQAQTESQASWQQGKENVDATVILEGPAGRWLYGRGMDEDVTPESVQRMAEEQGLRAVLRQQRERNKGELTSALKQTFNVKEVTEEKDPVRRAEIAREERAARDAARAPYVAPEVPPIAISRVATRGGTQLAEVISHLEQSGLAARPDLVYGAYRVPDRISQALTPNSERGRLVEWDVVHAPLPPGAAPTSAPSVVATGFLADTQLVRRAVGEPSVLDEDVALEFLARAGLGPEQCLGVARMVEMKVPVGHSSGDEGSSPVWALPGGVVVLHPAGASGVHEQMLAHAPLELTPPEQRGVHVEVLNWGELARVVQPMIAHPPPVPSQFPYLPSTPQELLRAYLEVVGLQPRDCYGAQATVQRAQEVRQAGVFTTNLGPKQPCADGKERMRARSGDVVVVAYRDRPEYVAGRARWAAYQLEVLQAHLERGTGARAVVDDDGRAQHVVIRALERIDAALHFFEAGAPESMPPFRYCWPPSGPGR
jgi:hypothetical protein